MAKVSVQKKDNKPFIGLLVLVAVLGVAVLGYTLTRPGARALTVDPAVPAGTAEGYLIGNANAPVQVIEFGDFECPGCGSFANVTEPDIRARLVNTGTVAFRYFDFPLSQHKNSWTAHTAASCAADQGKFWEMHDRLYAEQDKWNMEATSNPVSVFRRYATDLGLDLAKWDACLATQPHTARIKANAAEGTRRKIGGTPTFIIGDQMVPSGPLAYDAFKRYVDEALVKAPPRDSGAPPAARPSVKKAATQ